MISNWRRLFDPGRDYRAQVLRGLFNIWRVKCLMSNMMIVVFKEILDFDLGIDHHCEPLANSNCKSSHSTVNFSAPKRFVDLKSTSKAPNDSWVKLTQKQTGNEIWLQPEFGELPLDRWLWKAASCRSDVVFVTCIFFFFASDVFFGTCDVLFVIWGVSLLLEMFFCRVIFSLLSVVFS